MMARKILKAERYISGRYLARIRKKVDCLNGDFFLAFSGAWMFNASLPIERALSTTSKAKWIGRSTGTGVSTLNMKGKIQIKIITRIPYREFSWKLILHDHEGFQIYWRQHGREVFRHRWKSLHETSYKSLVVVERQFFQLQSWPRDEWRGLGKYGC